jgi:hypothetical protein
VLNVRQAAELGRVIRKAGFEGECVAELVARVAATALTRDCCLGRGVAARVVN